jgi:hypothetical protein
LSILKKIKYLKLPQTDRFPYVQSCGFFLSAHGFAP